MSVVQICVERPDSICRYCGASRHVEAYRDPHPARVDTIVCPVVEALSLGGTRSETAANRVIVLRILDAYLRLVPGPADQARWREADAGRLAGVASHAEALQAALANARAALQTRPRLDP